VVRSRRCCQEGRLHVRGRMRAQRLLQSTRGGSLRLSGAQRDSASGRSVPGGGWVARAEARSRATGARVCAPPLDLPPCTAHQPPSAPDCDKKRTNLQGDPLAPAVSWEGEGTREGRRRRVGPGQASKRQGPGGERSRCGEAERDRGTGKRVGGCSEREGAEDDQRGKGGWGARGGRRRLSQPAVQDARLAGGHGSTPDTSARCATRGKSAFQHCAGYFRHRL
jgi:hypothetical protein